MVKISPLLKGLITSVLMLVTSLALYYTNQPAGSWLQYFIYIFYAGGITWALLDFSRSDAYTGKFGELFGQGFRCFIMVTLVLVTFTGIFTKMHPEFAEESAVLYREELVKQKNKTPAEIDAEVVTYKDQFVTKIVSISIFGYLIMGTIFTAAGAGLLLMRKR